MDNVTSITAPLSGGGDFEIAPEGVYIARCYQMIDVGTQTVTSAKFGTSKKRQVYLFWELLQNDDGEAVRMADGETPFSVLKPYKLSMHQKAALRIDLNSWRGKAFTDEEAKDFDITKLLNAYCLLQVTHTVSGDKTYANVDTIMKAGKTQTQGLEGINELISFSITNPNMKTFEKLPEWLQNKIRDGEEWQVETEDGGITADGKVVENTEATGITQEEIDDIPF